MPYAKNPWPESPQAQNPKAIQGSGVLTPQQAIFIAKYLECGNATTAALAAGYSKNSASQQGAALLRDNKAVRYEIEQRRKAVAISTEYGAKEAMQEAKDCIEFAKDTGNANAYAKAVELRAKIMGLLVDKLDARLIGGFSIQISGIDDGAPDTTQLSVQTQESLANAMMAILPKANDDEEIEAEFKPVNDEEEQDEQANLLGETGEDLL